MKIRYVLESIEHHVTLKEDDNTAEIEAIFDRCAAMLGPRGALVFTKDDDEPEIRHKPNSRIVRFLGLHEGK